MWCSFETFTFGSGAVCKILREWNRHVFFSTHRITLDMRYNTCEHRQLCECSCWHLCELHCVSTSSLWQPTQYTPHECPTAFTQNTLSFCAVQAKWVFIVSTYGYIDFIPLLLTSPCCTFMTSELQLHSLCTQVGLYCIALTFTDMEIPSWLQSTPLYMCTHEIHLYVPKFGLVFPPDFFIDSLLSQLNYLSFFQGGKSCTLVQKVIKRLKSLQTY